MSQKAYLSILKFGIYLVFISFFLVFKSFLFPFITSKQIYFNILIEILFVLWLAFIIKYPEWRPFGKAPLDKTRGRQGKPKKSWISIGLISFFVVMLVSCFTGVDFNLSFWGDVERMLGWFHVVHFLLFYFIIITVMRRWQDWQKLFILSLAISVLVIFYAMTREPNYGTIGNTAYVSGLAIFNMYFALILFFRSFHYVQNWEKNWVIRASYLAIALINISILNFTGTRGAYVGLGVSIFILLLLFVLLNKSKRVKLFSLTALIIICAIVALTLIYPNSTAVRGNKLLSRITQIDLQDDTLQTRFIAWRAAWHDFSKHPLLGTGHGNFAIIFDKYFDPTFYNYTESETYFDRAHNNLVDIASTTGILGLISYLFIFIAAGYYLLKGYRRKKIKQAEFILLVCLIIAYFVQNLAVFDSLVTFVSLMIMLGFIYWLSRDEEEIYGQDKTFENKEIYILLGVGLIILTIIYQYNYRPIKMLIGTIEGQRIFNSGDIAGTIDKYKQALSYNTILDRDSRTSLIRSLISNSNILHNIDQAKAQEIVDYVIELGEENVKYNPQDSLNQMMLAQVLNLAASLNIDNPGDFSYYSNRAEEAIDKSIEASPGRVPIYFSKAQIYVTRGEKDKAIEVLKYALSLNEIYPDSQCQIARVYLFYQMEDEGYGHMDKCLDLGGAKRLMPSSFVRVLVNHYVEEQDWSRAIKVYEQLTTLEPNNAEIWVRLAKIYASVGEKEKAEAAATKAAEIDIGLRRGAEEFIKSLE